MIRHENELTSAVRVVKFIALEVFAVAVVCYEFPVVKLRTIDKN